MNPWLWIAFLGLVGTLVVLDLVVFTRRPREVSAAEGRSSVALWALAAMAFSAMVASVYHTDWQNIASLVSEPIDNKRLTGHSAWLQFITCYVLELALSVDNIAVMVLLYAYYRVPARMIGRALFWTGIASLCVRFGMILGAASLLRNVHWFHWVLGGMLIIAMLRLLVLPDEQTDFDRRWYIRPVRSLLKPSDTFYGHKLTARVDGHRATTPLLLVVIIGTLLDFAFAFDSVPALFSVTRDPFIAFTASAMALLGMRSLYFAVAPSVRRFRFLKPSLVAILLFVSVKMLLARFDTDYRNVPTVVTLAVVIGVMMLGIGASILRNRALAMKAKATEPPRPPVITDITEAIDIARRNFRKVLILMGGTAVILIGIAIAPLPGPGPTVLLPIGLAILATEFVWARVLLNRVKTGAFNLSDRADAIVDRTTIFIIPMVVIGWWLIAWGVMHWLHLKWYFMLVIFGSPFMPVGAWAANYLRKRFRARAHAPSPRREADSTKPRDSSRPGT